MEDWSCAGNSYFDMDEETRDGDLSVLETVWRITQAAPPSFNREEFLEAATAAVLSSNEAPRFLEDLEKLSKSP